MLDKVIERSDLWVCFVLVECVAAKVNQEVCNIILHHSIVDLAPLGVTDETMGRRQNPPLRDKRGTTEGVELGWVRERPSEQKKTQLDNA